MFRIWNLLLKFSFGEDFAERKRVPNDQSIDVVAAARCAVDAVVDDNDAAAVAAADHWIVDDIEVTFVVVKIVRMVVRLAVVGMGNY